MLARVCAVLLAIATAGVQAADKTPYTPSSTVEDYHRFDFELTGSYAFDVAKVTVIPLAIVGLVLAIVLTVWSCCRCRGRCEPKSALSPTAKKAIAVTALVLTAACVAIIIYGFRADEKQSDAFQEVPDLIDRLLDWQNQTVGATQRLLDQLNLMLETVEDINNLDPTGQYVDSSLMNDIETATDKARAANDEVDRLVESTDLKSIKSQFGEDVEEVDDARHIAVVITLVLLLVFTLVQLSLSLLAAFRNAPWVASVQPWITAIFIFLIFLVWLVCGVLFGTSVFFADYCVDPDNNLLRVTDNENDDTLRFYLMCDSDQTLLDPLEEDRNSAVESLNDADTLIENLEQQVDCTGQPADCQQVEAKVDDLVVQVDQSLVDLRFIVNQTECAVLNGLYQAVVNTVCDSGFESLRRFFEILVAMASVMVLVEILRRVLPRKADRAGSNEGITLADQKSSVV